MAVKQSFEIAPLSVPETVNAVIGTTVVKLPLSDLDDGTLDALIAEFVETVMKQAGRIE